jgi:hypothetical protein
MRGCSIKDGDQTTANEAYAMIDDKQTLANEA